MLLNSFKISSFFLLLNSSLKIKSFTFFMQEKITKLIELITYHQQKYYNSEPELSDAEFDALWDELKRIDPKNYLFNRVGKDESGQLPKRKHIIFMCSQEKVSTREEFEKWNKKTECPKKLCQWKLDGISVEIQYKNGKFTQAITRGDGKIGDLISANTKKMGGFLPEVESTFTGATRAEIVMLHSVFKKKYANDYANCRNLASGITKRSSGEGSDDLILIYYDAMSVDGKVSFERESDKLNWMKEQNFDIVENFEFKTVEELLEYREELTIKRSDIDIDIDGLVIKCDLIDKEDLKRNTPKRQVAFKFPTEKALSTLLDVEWSIKGTTYTPIALIEEVELAGTRVKRASLANPDEIRRLGLMKGSSVLVSKRGDIIPKIEKVVDNPSSVTPINFPTQCKACESKLVDGGARLYCPNKSCPNLDYHRVLKWIKKLGIKHYGKILLKKLVDAGLVTKIADLYKITAKDIASLEREGHRSGEIALKNLLLVKEVSLARFIGAFDIQGVGESIAKLVTDAGYETLEAIRDISVTTLTSIDGMGEITADLLIKGIQNLYDDMQAVLKTGMIAIKNIRLNKGSLNGKSFCFTGALKTMKRSDARVLVEENGGVFKKSIVKNLDYLVTNESSNSVKYKKAIQNKINVVTEEEFLKLLN